MYAIKRMLKEQHQDLDDLTSEVQRREITPERVIRLMKVVRRNVQIIERMATVLDRMGAPDLPDAEFERRAREAAAKKPPI